MRWHPRQKDATATPAAGRDGTPGSRSSRQEVGAPASPHLRGRVGGVGRLGEGVGGMDRGAHPEHAARLFGDSELVARDHLDAHAE
eukprot:4467813-Prymnesium_polylepis.2